MPLLRVVAVVDERRVALDLAGVDAEARDAARERIGDGLEDECGDVRVRVDRRALLRRARHALDDQVEQRAGAEILRRDAAGNRIDLVARHGVLEGVGDVLGRDLLAAEVALHQRLVGLDDRVEQLRRGTPRPCRPARPGWGPARLRARRPGRGTRSCAAGRRCRSARARRRSAAGSRRSAPRAAPAARPSTR